MRVPDIALDRMATVRAHMGDGLGPSVASKCRVELSRKIQVDADGAAAEVVSGRAFFPPEMSIPPDSELTLDGATYRTTSENRPMSVLGAPYVEVRFQ